MPSTKTKRKRVTLHVSEKARDFINDLVDRKAFSNQQECVNYLIELYKKSEKDKANKAKKMSELFENQDSNEKDQRFNPHLKTADKLRLFVDAVIKYNESESKKDDPKYIHLNNGFIFKETGINAHTGVKPFMESIRKEIETHYAKFGIGREKMNTPIMKAKNEKGHSLVIQKILETEGIEKVFRR